MARLKKYGRAVRQNQLWPVALYDRLHGYAVLNSKTVTEVIHSAVEAYIGAYEPEKNLDYQEPVV